MLTELKTVSIFSGDFMAISVSKRDNLTLYLFTVPGVIFFIFLFLLPAFMAFFYSFTDWDGISHHYNFVGITNFIKMFTDTRVSYSLKFSLGFTLFFVIITNVVALALAFMLNAKIKAKTFFRGIYFFPAVISLVVVGLIFDQIFFHVLPIFGKALGIDILSRSPLGNEHLAPIAVLFVKIWREVPVPTILFIAGLQSVPKDLLEAAVIDGAGWFTRFKNVIIPFLIPVISMNIVLTVRSGVMVFDVIKVMTSGGPGYSTSSIGIIIYNMGFYEMKFGFATSISLFLFFIIGVVSIAQIRILKNKGTGQL